MNKFKIANTSLATALIAAMLSFTVSADVIVSSQGQALFTAVPGTNITKTSADEVRVGTDTSVTLFSEENFEGTKITIEEAGDVQFSTKSLKVKKIKIIDENMGLKMTLPRGLCAFIALEKLSGDTKRNLYPDGEGVSIEYFHPEFRKFKKFCGETIDIAKYAREQFSDEKGGEVLITYDAQGTDFYLKATLPQELGVAGQYKMNTYIGNYGSSRYVMSVDQKTGNLLLK